MKVLCSISTRGRYDTTLPMTIQSVAMQEVKPDKLVIFDDNDEDKTRDIRSMPHYLHLLKLLDYNQIEWTVVWGERKGQHFNHQKANKMGFDLVWRVDDDCIAEPNVLKNLLAVMTDDVGAVGGSVIEPPLRDGEGNGSILGLTQPNKQWFRIKKTEEVDHLHCSFLYRAGIVDYNLALSKVGHREESLFTYDLKKAGYKILVTPAVTWHCRMPSGGIRDGQQEMYMHDEMIFRRMVDFKSKLIVLDCGLGDHIVFKSILPEIKAKYKDLVLSCCYPEIFEGEQTISIQDAKNMIDIEKFSVYRFMIEHQWKKELVEAFREMYLK